MAILYTTYNHNETTTIRSKQWPYYILDRTTIKQHRYDQHNSHTIYEITIQHVKTDTIKTVAIQHTKLNHNKTNTVRSKQWPYNIINNNTIKHKRYDQTNGRNIY